MKHATKIFHFASLLMCFLFAASFSSYADGSKDIYPDGVKGGRARLRASTASSASYPFPTLGTHYVYAKAGEVIAIASSTQGVASSNANNASRLILTGPDGSMIVSHQTPRTGVGSEVGRIPDRNAEKLGPHLPNQADGGYTPYYYDVPAGAEGIYKVEFTSNGGSTSTTTQRQNEVYAYADWAQNNSSATIAAWDISISNAAKNAWQKGRVYANILNMDIDAGFKDNYNFYGQLKILTKDGYTYNVKNNGNNGISFTFFVNNKGFIDTDGQPLYQSLNTTTGISDKIQNPTTEDTESGITHKIFYTLPDPDLPKTASGAVPGGTTWLKNPRLTPTVENLNIVGVDGTVGQVSNKGGRIRFDANLAGRFKIEIVSKVTVGNPGYFPTRAISGSALAGTNNVPWDGKDGAGVPLPNGLVPAILNIQLQGAEVHFPYFDMEINPNGMILELLNTQLNGVQSDIVYWDDSLILPARDIPSNPINASQFIEPLGTSSSVNGHKWGSSSSPSSGTFGDEKSIDTWTFILGAKEIKEITVDVKEADLEVLSIVPSKTIVTKGDELSYTVKVKNGGPSDVIGKKDPISGLYDNTGAPFTFKLPAGFIMGDMQFVSACGATEAVPVAFDPATGLYKSVLKLPSGCEGQYVFKGTVGPAMVAGNMEVWATIMRPNDVTDIDATNPNPNVPPTDPYFECSAYDPLSGLAIPCNNIKKNNTATVVNKITATKEINGNPAKVKAGDVLTYNIILENTNSTDKTGVTASDVLPAGLVGATVISHGGTLTGTTITWANLTVPANNKITLSFKTTVGPNSTGITSIRNVASVVDPIDPTTPLTPEVLVPVELVSSFTSTKKVTGGLTNNKITAGSEITYSIEVSNTGNTALANLEISDIIPDQMSYMAGTADNGGVLTGSTLNWVINVPVGQAKTVTFKVKVADNLTGVAAIKNMATITDPANPATPLSPEVEVPTDPIRSFTATKVVSAGLNNNKIVARSTITYSIGVKNTGSTELTGIKISDVIPAQTTYKIGSADNGGVITGNTLNWTIDVPFGQTKTLNFQVEVAKDLTGIAAIKNVATVADPVTPTNPPVNPEVEVPTDPVKSFTATKKITGGLQNNKIVAGSTITYSIEVTNTGSTALTNIAIADNLPSHTTYVNGTANLGGSLTGSTLNWVVNLAFGETKTVSFQVKVADDLSGVATIKNAATVTDPTTPTHPPVIPEVEVPTDPIRSFTATKKVSAGLQNNKIVAGSTITYSIEVKNTGSTALTNIAIADNIPTHTTYVEGTANLGGGLTGNTLNWVVNLAFGETKTVSFQVKVADDLTGVAAIKNAATITDPVVPTNPPVIPEVEVPTDPIRSFTAVKRISGGLNNNKIVAGSTITYSIDVKNTGSTELTGIKVSDVIPAHATYKTGSADNGGAITGNTLNWTVDVPFGQTKTLNFQVEVAKDLTGVAAIKNVATVTDPLTPTNPPVNPEVEAPTDPIKSFTATKKISGGLQNNKIVAGSTITYSIEVKNTGSTALTNIEIADKIPGHTTYVNGTANLGGSLTGSTLNWVVNLAFGESKTVSFQVKVADDLTGVAAIKNAATVTDPTTPTHPPVIPEVEVPTDPIRSFTAVKRISGGLNNNKIVAGSTITYSIDVKNTGSTELTGIKISDVIPAYTTYKTGSADNAGTLTGNTLNWTVDVPFGQTKTLNFQVEVAKDLTGVAAIKNVATVTDPLTPTNPPVNPEVEAPTDPIKSFTATKKISGGLQNNKIVAGSTITYSIEVKNTGSTALTNIEIADKIPGHTTYVNGTANLGGSLIGSTLNWVVNLAFGESKTVSFQVKVADDLTGVATIKNSATVTDPTTPTHPPVIPEVEVPTDPIRSFTAVKRISGGLNNNKIVAGSTITYSIDVKNTGSTELTGIKISDVIPAYTTYKTGTADNGGAITGNTLNWTVDVPFGQTKTLNFQVEVAKDLTGVAAIKNVATVTDPLTPTNPPVNPEVEAPTDPIKSFTATKKISGGLQNNKIVAGSTITYSIEVKNTGSTALTNIEIADKIPGHTTYVNGTANLGGSLTGSTLNWVVNLAFGESKTVSFQVKVADDLTGVATIKNAATVTDPTTPTHPPVIPEVEVPTDPIRSFTAVKKISGGLNNNKIVAGSTITYSIDVKNTGSTELTGIKISDVIPAYTTYKTGTADNGGAITGNTLNWTVDVPFGQTKTLNFQVEVAKDLTGVAAIKNVATVTDPLTPTNPPVNPEVEAPTDPIKSFTATKKISGGLQNNKIVAGSTITYSIEVKNTGSTALTNIEIADKIPGHTTYVNGTANLGGSLTGSTLNWVVNLAFGESKTVSFQVKVADDLTGVATIKNAATVTDPTTPTHPPVIPEVEVPTDPVKSFTATKKISGGLQNNKIVAGSTITYSIEVKNTGSTALTNIEIADKIPGHTTYVNGTANLGGSLTGSTLNWVVNLAFGETKTVSFQVKVADDLTGVATIKNAATVTDPTTPTHPPVIPEVEVPTDPVRSFTATKKISGGLQNNKIVAGSTITYSIEVKNTGSTALTNIAIADKIPGYTAYVNGTANLGGSLTGSTLNWVVNLAFGESKTVSFQVKVADNLTGIAAIKNAATVTDPTIPTKPPVVPEVEVPTDAKRSFTTAKRVVSGLVNGKVPSEAELIYAIDVVNTGGEDLIALNIADDLPAGTSFVRADHNGSAIGNRVNWTINVPFGQTKTVLLTLKVATDLTNVETIVNKATVTDPKDPGNPKTPEVTVPTEQKAAITLSKTAIAGDHQKVGEVISYQLVLKNTGNVAVKNIIVTDDNADAGSISPARIANLAPNVTVNISAKHTLTQGDLDRGYVSNLAKADGKDPKNKEVHAESKDPSPVPGAPTDPDCKDCTITPTIQKGALTLSKTAVAGTHNKVGGAINYNLVLKNTGNVTLKNIIITDDNADAGSIRPANIASLTPGATVNITAKHTLTQEDLDRGSVSNLAKADGKDPKNKDVHAESKDPSPIPGGPTNPVCKDCTVTPTEQLSGINLVKKISNKGTGEQDAFILNDKIEYTFIIKNTGNTTLKGIVLNDPLLGTSTIQIPGSLAPGASVSHKEYYTITAADIANGKVTNQATVKAKDPKGEEVTALSGTDAGNKNPTVISLAKPPVAKDDLAKAEQNKPVKIEVQKNDEPGNSPIVPGSTKIITQPKNGTLTLNPDGTVTYTPNPGFTGTDEFVYTVTDKNGQISNPATVKVEVTPSKPVAIDDVAETQFNKEVEIPLLHNDKTDGAAFEKPTVEIIEQPKNGVLKKNPDGTVVYVPNSGFTGKDSFTYKVKDANGNWTNVATANITVKGFFIPNVITPNGDGKNDEFVIVGLEEFNSAELTIFNRWGNEVYRNGNYRNTWTGEGLNEGTYYYLIRLKKDGKLEVYKGWVLIKR